MLYVHAVHGLPNSSAKDVEGRRRRHPFATGLGRTRLSRGRRARQGRYTLQPLIPEVVPVLAGVMRVLSDSTVLRVPILKTISTPLISFDLSSLPVRYSIGYLHHIFCIEGFCETLPGFLVSLIHSALLGLADMMAMALSDIPFDPGGSEFAMKDSSRLRQLNATVAGRELKVSTNNFVHIYVSLICPKNTNGGDDACVAKISSRGSGTTTFTIVYH
jgi:hypothetical protein